MEIEKLEIDWKCSCEESHKCVVIEEDESPDARAIAVFAVDNNALCIDEGEAGDDTLFLREGDGPQKALSEDEIKALDRSKISQNIF